ncbi:copper resistance CopC family protein [Microbacterium sp. Gd 4-13]|uniref:copper resistance CopC family protein n=1 Tax=Microbacterium sp. Gd 4-13 TaxID=2173179 RepID=UPI001401DDF3|nr:copper resistance CopC family protein [Microbacterium sp. Gd 4-13]
MLFPAPATAHDSIVSSYPAAASSVDSPPDEISITFSAELLGEGGTGLIEITGPDGVVYSEGEPEIAEATITQHLSANAPSGRYTVLWRVVSSDGHPTSGEYGFEVLTSAPLSPSPTPSTTAAPTATPTPSSTESAGTDGVRTEGHGEATGGGAALPVFLITGVTVVLIGLLIVVLLLRNARRRRDAEQP